MSTQSHQEESLLAIEAETPTQPPLYRVLLLNDDFTPMDFVVMVLQRFFSLSLTQATEVMLKVHYDGKGLCGVYPHDIASTKVEQVTAFSVDNQHPLKCVMEEDK